MYYIREMIMNLRYQVFIDGRLQMATMFITDLDAVIRERIEAGYEVKVIDTRNGRHWVNVDGDQIANEQEQEFTEKLRKMKPR